MAHPRKRKRKSAVNGYLLDGPPSKKGRKGPKSNEQLAPLQAQHAVLNRFYPQVLTLRNYVLSRLPSTSKVRRKKVTAVGRVAKAPGLPISDVERSLGALLDSTLIGIPKEPETLEEDRLKGWQTFSQKGDESYVTLSDGVAGCIETQALVRPKSLSHQ
ncbi:hypothetical protein F4677DRAFT_13815 [Hypoxylon crocopeplum]|nr:hypothetical protein F4677DRAFT_13815 [Hypoxylon crocopeplum]